MEKIKLFLKNLKAKIAAFAKKVGKKNLIIGGSTIVGVIVLIIILSVCLTQCSGNGTSTGSSSSNANTVTVTFLNPDGSTLATKSVEKGETVSYDGTPTRASTTEGDIVTQYSFKSWDKSLENITEDTTIVAQYFSIKYTSNKSTVYYGRYPQSQVTDDATLTTLNSLYSALPTSDNLGQWVDFNFYIANNVVSYCYRLDVDTNNDGENDYRAIYFTKPRPSSCSSNNNGYTGANGFAINTVYWFKYEEITWKTSKDKEGYLNVYSDKILDAMDYWYDTSYRYSGVTDYKGETINSIQEPNGTDVFANDYRVSTARSFLNTTFFKSAIIDGEPFIQEATVKNGAETTKYSDNGYAVPNTSDKMYLLSYQEATQLSDAGISLVAYPTDYAKCMGIQVINDSSSYWLRSPYASDCYSQYVTRTGAITSDFVNYIFGIRPACLVKIG